MKRLIKCKYCGLEKITTGFGMSFHENRCKQNPNRKIHDNKIDRNTLKSIVEYIGDKWKEFYYGLK